MYVTFSSVCLYTKAIFEDDKKEQKEEAERVTVSRSSNGFSWDVGNIHLLPVSFGFIHNFVCVLICSKEMYKKPWSFCRVIGSNMGGEGQMSSLHRNYNSSRMTKLKSYYRFVYVHICQQYKWAAWVYLCSGVCGCVSLSCHRSWSQWERGSSCQGTTAVRTV